MASNEINEDSSDFDQQSEENKIDLHKFFRYHVLNETAPVSDTPWAVGPSHLFTYESLDTFGKTFYLGDLVFVTKDIRDTFWTWCGTAITSNLVQVLEVLDRRLTYYPFIIRRNPVNTLEQRTVEFGIQNSKGDFPIFGQFSFPNDEPEDLITDCVMFLNEYKPVFYSIGGIISSDCEKFALELFILERGANCKPDKEKTRELTQSLYYADKYKPEERHDWGPLIDHQDIKKCFYNGDLSKYNAKILLHKTITAENLNEPVKYELDLAKILPNKTGIITIEMKPESFTQMYGSWNYNAKFLKTAKERLKA